MLGDREEEQYFRPIRERRGRGEDRFRYGKECELKTDKWKARQE